MNAVKIVLCAAIVSLSISVPADARSSRHKSYKAVHHAIWTPLFLGVGY